jgi:hypothetical protein
MESELSLRLHHCVEAMSLGVNNGDIAANLPFLDAFVEKYHVNFVLFEHGSYVMNDFDADLYRRTFGYDPEFRHLAHVERKDGQLVPVPRSKEAPLHAKAADLSSVVPGLPFFDTLRTDKAFAPPSAQSAYRHFSEVVEFVRARFPNVVFVMYTALDQAQCHGRCVDELRTAAGQTIPHGADVFVRNMKELCQSLKLACIHPEVAPGTNVEPSTYLTFVSDGHFNARGHQWLARALSRGMERIVSRP